MFFFIALGTVLPMMHQSSLGTLLVVMGVQIHPLWQTPMQPLLYLLSAITMGYAVVLFESCLTSTAYRRKIEGHLLTPLAKIMLGFLAVYLVVRVGDLLVRGALPKAFVPSVEALTFWIEMLSFIAPLILIGAESNRRNPARLFLAGVLLMLGGACCASTAS
jgi:Ni/Fe-hydrogenase subunit HybB-like protein